MSTIGTIRAAKILWLIALVAAFAGPLSADEPAQRFLDQLRENEYFDVALDYLDAMEKSPLAPAEFKSRIKFEKASTLLAAADATSSFDQIEQHLDRADSLLQEFAQSRPSPQLLAESERVRGRTLYTRGRLAASRSNSEKLTSDEKKPLQEQARRFFTESLAVLEKAVESQKAALKSLKEDTSDPESVERAQQMRIKYIQTRFQLPEIKEQMAETYGESDAERKKWLGQAATEFADIAKDYASFFQGSITIPARLAAGRCYKKLGQNDKALELLTKILEDEVPRAAKLEAATLAIECWEKQKTPAHKEIVGNIGKLADVLGLRDVRDPKVAAVQLGYAKACKNFAEELSKGPNKESMSKRIAELKREAAKFGANVARGNNPLREAAKQFMDQAKMTAEIEPEATAPPTNFAEARAQAIAFLDNAQEQRREAQDLRNRLASAGDDKAALEEELNQKIAQSKESARQALDLLKVALKLATKDISREDLNGIRMRQALAHLFMENYYEASVLGEYLLDRFANVGGSREAAGIARQAMRQLYVAAPEDQREFERQRLESLCNRIIQQWPDQPGTDEAANILISLALKNSELDEARKLLETMEAGSPARVRLEIHLGRVYWSRYVAESKKPAPDAAVKDAALQDAEKYLKAGVAALKPADLSVDTAFGVLNLAQLYLERGDVDQAISQLESSPIGPLDVIKQRLDPAQDQNFVRESYQVALRAYVSGMRGRKGSTDMIDKARNIVTALREMTNDAAKKDALVAMYYQLAVELLAQFDGLEQADEKAAFATSLATFMRSIQEQSSDGRTLMWVGSTLNSVAEKLGAAELEKNARDYYEQAKLALDAAAQAGFGSDPEANLRLAELKRQTALAQRGLGNYDEALELLVEVLKTKPSHLPAQVDAAMTLQQLGERKNDADAFVKAVGGTRKETLPNSNRPTNVVWGWMLIAKATQAKEAFRDDYFNAVYNMAYCRLRWGELTKRNDAVNSALVEIQNQFKQFPELGGPRWKPKFNELAKQIQTRLGKSADGLQ